LPERGRRVSREARTPERSHSLDNNKGSTSSQDSTRACAGSDNGESKNMNLMVNGVPVGFTEESVSGKHITIRAGDTGRVQLYIDGNRRPKQYLMRGSSYSRDQTAYSDPGESTKR
jgi:shikimate 5-dehydrogenase